jgi:hypothetical protein
VAVQAASERIGSWTFKSGREAADAIPVSSHPRDLAWTKSGEPLLVEANGDTDYTFFSDEQLASERDRQQDQLDELTRHSGHSPAVSQLHDSIEREVGRMTAELKRRARLRHPSSRGNVGRLRPLRSLSWPPHSDRTGDT